MSNAAERQLIKNAAGLWQGVRGRDTFTVFLKASVNNDSLVGWHEYKVNGMVESSNMSYKGIYDSLSVLYIITAKREQKGDVLKMAFSDPHRSANLFLVHFDVFLPGKATWAITGFDGSEGQYGTYLGGVKPVIPPPSEIMKIKEWRMTRLQ